MSSTLRRSQKCAKAENKHKDQPRYGQFVPSSSETLSRSIQFQVKSEALFKDKNVKIKR